MATHQGLHFLPHQKVRLLHLLLLLLPRLPLRALLLPLQGRQPVKVKCLELLKR